MPAKECTARKCQLKDTVIDTDHRYCAACGAKLHPIQPSDPRSRRAIVSSTPVTPTATIVEDMVNRKHNTVWSQEAQAWVCWCGQEFPHSGSALIDHENIVERVPRSQSGLHTGGNIVTITPPITKPSQTDDWTCTPDISGCPLITKEMRPRVNIPYEMWKKWCYWAKNIKTEWLAYLIGDVIPRSEANPFGGWQLTDLWIPKQRVTSSHVTVSEDDLRNLRPGTIGDVHSHVSMGVFFSAEDQKHFNHEVHIVVNSREEVTSSVRIKLDCHRTSRSEGRLMLIGGAEDAALEAEMTSQFLIDPPIQAEASSPAANVASEASAPSTTSTSQASHSYSAHSPNTGFGRVRSNQDTWSAN